MRGAQFTAEARRKATRALFNETAQPGALALALKGYTAPPEHITYDEVELAVAQADAWLRRQLAWHRLYRLATGAP